MANIGNVGVGNFIPLSQDFNDKPLGKFGSRNVQAGNAPPPRANRLNVANAQQQVAQRAPARSSGVKRFFERVIDAITPQTVRSAGKFRRGLEDVSKTTGNLLGALAKPGGPDGRGVLQALGSLRSDAAPVTSRGQSFDAVLARRLDVHINKLSDDQLVAAAKGTQTGFTIPRDQAGDFQKIANHIQSAARSRLATRGAQEVAANIRSELQHVGQRPSDPGVTTAFTAGLPSTWGRRMEASNQWPGGLGDASHAVIKEALAGLQPNERSTYLSRLGYTELTALGHNKDDLGTGTDLNPVDLAISQELTGRINAKITEVKANATTLKDGANAFGNNPKGLMTALTKLNASVDQLRNMAGTGGTTEIDRDVGLAQAALFDHMKLTGDALKTLSDAEFLTLKAQLSEIGVHKARSKDALQADTTRRVNTTTSRIAMRFATTLRALTNEKSNTADFVQRFTEFRKEQSAALHHVHTLTGKELGKDDQTRFYRTVASNALDLAQVNGPSARDLNAKINSDDIAPVFGWCGEMGGNLAAKVTEKTTPEERAEVNFYFDMLESFDAISTVVAHRAAVGTGKDPVPYPFDHRADLNGQAKSGLAALGLMIKDGDVTTAPTRVSVLHDDVEAGLFSADLQDLVNNREPSTDIVKLSSSFVIDIPRQGTSHGVVQIDTGAGSHDLIPEDHKTNKTNLAVAQKGYDRLSALFGNDTIVSAVSAVVNQNALAFFLRGGLERADTNPFKDAQNNSVFMLGSASERKTYTISREPDGSARINLKYFNEPRQLMTGDQTTNNNGSNIAFDVDINIAADGTVSVPKYSYTRNMF